MTLLVKLFKTISIKNNPEQIINFLSPMGHGFVNIITADMFNDLKESHTGRPLPHIKSSHRLSFIL